ncbi:hypothetical protein [Streptomyces sp. Inha503]|uniref:hypothetical protein n=1 Tax=Streptomyces sp. Inha503 TaxID=3383314 RepID=UPI00399FEF2C
MGRLYGRARSRRAGRGATLAAGHSIHLNPTLNTLATPNGERDAPLHYLTWLAERVAAAETSSAVAEVPTEVAAPVNGLLPLTRNVVVRAWICASDLQGAALGGEPEPIARLGDTTSSMSQAACVILRARNHAPRAPQHQATAPPPSPARASACLHR